MSNASLAAGLVSSPIDGVVVRWRARMGSMGAPTFRIVHGTVMGAFTGAGTGGPVPAFNGVGGPFGTRLAIKTGDRIGIDLPCNGLGSPSVAVLSPGTKNYWVPALVDGETPGRSSSPASNSQLVNADVEPDTDGDVFGDETQDACLGLTGSVNGCPKADLALTKTANRGAESDVVTYTLVLTNKGPDPVPDAAISDTLPAGASFASSSGGGGLCSVNGRSVFCAAGGTLASGASTTRTITARLKAGKNQTNTATISSAALTQATTKAAGAGESNPANNTATAAVNVALPAVSNTKLSPSTFRLGSLLPKFTRKTPVGTTISFKFSEPARATLTFSQPKTGRRVGRRCVAQTRSNRRKPRCTIPNIRGTLSFNAHAGTNKVRFQGRLSRTRKLKPGRYTLTITATDSAGNRSGPKSTSFAIVG